MESQPPPTHPPRYPASHLNTPSQMPAHLAHVVNPQYALAPPPQPLQMSVPISGMPLPMPIPVPHHPSHHMPPHHHSHHVPAPHHAHTLLHHPQQPPTSTAQTLSAEQPREIPPPSVDSTQTHQSQQQAHHAPSALSQPPLSQSQLPPPQHPPHLPSLTHPHSSHVQSTSPPHPYYDHSYSAGAKIASLESELEKARQEIERLRLKLAEYEKERAKTESPKVQSRYWTPNEHKRFLEALQKFGPKDVRAIANYVGSRNATQVRTHAQKYFLRVAREAKQGSALQSARKRSMSESDLARVGRSVRTPPGSPVMRDNQQPAPLFPPTSLPTDAQMTPVSESQPALPPAQGPQSSKMQISTPSQGTVGQGSGLGRGGFSSSMQNSPKRGRTESGKPPAINAITTGGKPPVAAGKLSDNTGINLLSLVASERKMEVEKGGR